VGRGSGSRWAQARRQATVAAEGPAGPGPPAEHLAALVARVAERPAGEVRDDAALEADLGLDSLARVELLAAIEEELGRVVDETQLGPQATVGQLRRLVEAGVPGSPDVEPARWSRAPWAWAVRPLLQWLVFRLQDYWMDLEVVHPERAERLPLPSILIFNYHGPYAALMVLRALPPRLRARTAIAADDRLWRGRDRWQGWLGALAVRAFPFAKSGGAVRQSLEETGRWLDDEYAVVLSPEGEPELEGRPPVPGRDGADRRRAAGAGRALPPRRLLRPVPPPPRVPLPARQARARAAGRR
jgi:long-chain acyl-CoA synthetase